MPEKLWTLKDVADYTGYSEGTLYNRRAAGTGPRGINTGKHLRFRQSDVDAWLDSYADAAPTTGNDAA